MGNLDNVLQVMHKVGGDGDERVLKIYYQGGKTTWSGTFYRGDEINSKS